MSFTQCRRRSSGPATGWYFLGNPFTDSQVGGLYNIFPTRVRMDDPEDQIQDFISNMTQTQLLYLLQRIQQLSFLAPEHAKQLLTDNTQLSMALLHAEYMVGVKADKLLPLTSDEVRLAKERLYELRNPGSVNKRSYAESSVAPSQLDQSQEVAKGLAKLDPSVLAALTGGSQDILDIDHIVSQLFKLSDEQIAELPEEVQLLLLNALQNSS